MKISRKYHTRDSECELFKVWRIDVSFRRKEIDKQIKTFFRLASSDADILPILALLLCNEPNGLRFHLGRY